MSSKLIKGTVKSSWTPLNHEDSNNKVFEERRALVNKWFEMWTTSQRKTILEDLLMKCTGSQVEYAKDILSTKAVQNHVDFTRLLPRVLCLYIFSYLDPRSLCRASQACWYWKYLTEANEIWAPKCARLGWYFTGTVNSMESGFWKNQFIDNIHFLQVTRPAKEKPKQGELTSQDFAKHVEQEEALRKARKLKEKQLQAQNKLNMPWRGPDPKPIDIVRNNYIDNDEDNGSRTKSMRQNSKQYSRRISNDLRLNVVSKNMRPVSSNSNRNNHTQINNTELDHSNSSPSRNRTPVASEGHCKVVNNVGYVKDVSVKDNAISTIVTDEIPSGRPWAVAVLDQEES